MKTIVIFQIDASISREFHFCNLRTFKALDEKIGCNPPTADDEVRVREYYTAVWVGQTESETLDEIFEEFNIRRPDDFLGHSLSVGDIVLLDGDMWYCDSFGWKKIKAI